MMNENHVRDELIKTLELQIENVKANDEASYLLTQKRIDALAAVLELNVYGKSVLNE